MTRATHQVTFSVDTGSTSHISQHLPFNAERKQGIYWYHQFTTFGMLLFGIKPKTFRIPSGRSTIETPGQA